MLTQLYINGEFKGVCPHQLLSKSYCLTLSWWLNWSQTLFLAKPFHQSILLTAKRSVMWALPLKKISVITTCFRLFGKLTSHQIVWTTISLSIQISLWLLPRLAFSHPNGAMPAPGLRELQFSENLLLFLHLAKKKSSFWSVWTRYSLLELTSFPVNLTSLLICS